MMIISEEIVKSGVVRTLFDKFGETYHYYKEEMPQNFETASFTIERILTSRTDGYKGNIKLYNQVYDYVIQYFPLDETSTELNEEFDSILETLLGIDYITIWNRGNKQGLLRIESKSGEVIDKKIVYTIRIVSRIAKIEEKQKIQDLEVIQKIKEE